jgi:phage gp36-like protein
MTYAVKQDLVDRFGERELVQLTDRTNKPPSTVDDVVVGRALGDADGTIDGYVGKQYALPLSVVPPVLTKIAADLARYYLHGEAAGPDSIVTRNYNGAVAWLKDVAKGLVSIDDGAETPAQAGGGAIKTSAPNRVFTRDSLKGL